MEKMEEGTAKANEILEKESRDLLSHATTRVFSNLFRSDNAGLQQPLPQ